MSKVRTYPDDGYEQAICSPFGHVLRPWGIQSDTVAWLSDIHHRLWALEDRARSRRAPAEEIASVKVAIDAANAERHDAIDRLDGEVAYQSVATAEVVYCSTVGELCDRLVILDLKVANACRLAADPRLPSEVRAQCDRDRASVERWRVHVERCLTQMIGDMAERRAILPPRHEFKAYNNPLLNPVTRQEIDAPVAGEPGTRPYRV